MTGSLTELQAEDAKKCLKKLSYNQMIRGKKVWHSLVLNLTYQQT